MVPELVVVEDDEDEVEVATPDDVRGRLETPGGLDDPANGKVRLSAVRAAEPAVPVKNKSSVHTFRWS